MNNLTYFEQISLQQANRQFYLDLAIAIITFASVALVYLDYRNRKNKERAEKSIEIAKDFAQTIIEPISILYAFFSNFKMDFILKQVNFIQLEEFDMEEVESLYCSDDIRNYKTIMDTNDPKHEMRDMICEMLNNLEYMCMYIATNVADEKYIYNSLHQQFLKAVSLLYFEISFPNTDSKDKYYTNIIQVYNLWKNKYIRISKKENRFIKKQKKMKKKFLPSTPKL